MTLIEAVRATLRRLHYAEATEDAYVHWIRELVRFHRKRHPRTMGAPELTTFLNYLAVDWRLSASTHNQALCAIVFLYKHVLQMGMPALGGLERARRPEQLPTVISRHDVIALLERLEPPFRLMGEIYYGSGLRLMECVSLRIKDIDLERRQLMVRRGKGNHDRAALLPVRAREGLAAQIERTRARHQAELAAGRGEVDLPHALRSKMPQAGKSSAWQYLFPASRPCIDPATGRVVLHHLHETAVQKAVYRATRLASIDKRVTCHVLRKASA